MKRILYRKCGFLCNMDQSMTLIHLMSKGGIGMLARNLMGMIGKLDMHHIVATKLLNRRICTDTMFPFA